MFQLGLRHVQPWTPGDTATLGSNAAWDINATLLPSASTFSNIPILMYGSVIVLVPPNVEIADSKVNYPHRGPPWCLSFPAANAQRVSHIAMRPFTYNFH
jgi:hypothetical protein